MNIIFFSFEKNPEEITDVTLETIKGKSFGEIFRTIPCKISCVF